ncbi:MAG: P-loop NTPase [Propionibacteriaceae bacterium]|nr:P-loop NTPase [Propionibacteriaceae bacterium]
MNSQRQSIMLISDDQQLVQLAHASAAACGAPISTSPQLDDLRLVWGQAATVLIGADLAQSAAGLGLPPRPGVFLLGRDGGEDGLCQWSSPLRAAVIALPSGSRWLSRVLAAAGPGQAGSGRVVAVLGGVGGVGASTLAAGLALAGASARRPAALVDLDVHGGGIDLLMGLEAVAGWRWDSLSSASGQVSVLNDRLPATDGVVVVSTSRTDRVEPPAAAVTAVVDSLRRSCGLVVVDLGRSAGLAGRAAVDLCERLLLLTGASVRAVAGAQAVLAGSEDRPFEVVVRAHRESALSPAAVADALGHPLFGAIPWAPALASAADRGLPPGSAGSGRWARACRRLAAQLADAPAEASGRRGR